MTDYIQWLRSKIGPMKIPMVFATAVIVDEEGQILWQQRSDVGWWGLPGGVVELSETLQETLVREVYEESGLTVKPERLLGIYSSPDFDFVYPNGDQVQQITFTFVCRVRGGSLKVDHHESLDLKWIPEKELPETSPWYRAMIHDYLLKTNEVYYQHGRAGERQENKPLYKTLRQYIGQAAFVAPGAGAIILDEKGRVLLQRRSDNGEWGIPGGGLELGERIDQTARQEVWEETRLKVEIERLSGVYSDQHFLIAFPNGDQMKVIAVIFVCRVVGGVLEVDGDESLELRYFYRHQFPALPPRILTVIDDALKNDKSVVLT